jgi:acyl-CoA synthetase (AMP-forming)/AMP-acid ligase II
MNGEKNMNSKMESFADILRWRAEHQGDKCAFTFLADGEIDRAEDLTYAELDRRARMIAAFLQERNIRGHAVFLVYSDGLEFPAAFAGCLYAGAMAVPTYAPDRGVERARARMEAMQKSCKGVLALTSAKELPAVKRMLQGSELLRTMDVVASDEIEPGLAGLYRHEKVGADHLAFLLSTSGSTATTKSVAVSHANAMAQCAYLSLGFGYDDDSIHVGWPPVSNTGGFVFTICNPLYTGFRSVRLPAVAFLGQPARWLAAITHYRGTHGHGPNFAYDLCASRVSVEERAGLDLRCWKHAINGAEPIQPQTLEKFTRRFEPCGFHWGAFSLSYGLSEATMQVARSGSADGPVFLAVDAIALRTTGRAMVASEGTRLVRRLPLYSGHGELHRSIVIINPETGEEQAAGYEGEICVSGADIAQGYLNHPEATRETFQFQLADGRGPFLRTGDLGFMLDGRLCVSGRLKDVIIIRGANHSPLDFEWSASRSHPALNATSSAAFAVVASGEERLVIVAEVETGAGEQPAVDAKEVARAIRAAIAREHHIHAWAVVLVRPGSIPKTPNGKIQRRACREAYLAGSLPVVHEASSRSADLHAPGVLIESIGHEVESWEPSCTGRLPS